MLENLSPQLAWLYFEEITKIPRPSKKEEKILQYLKEFAAKNSLEYKQDNIGNMVIYSPATSGYESQEAVILQSHVDMVCEKDNSLDFDFDNDSINIYAENGWVKAKGTTLGADCGIGMAISMAALTDKSLKRPAIEALFTVDEESGLTGAKHLDFSMLSSNKLINLDSEDEGELFVGCAGGIDTIGIFDIDYINLEGDFVIIEIEINGLIGGHSGDDINKQRANAVVLLNRFLYSNFNQFNINLVDIDAGALRNAIPREARAKISIDKSSLECFAERFNKYIEDIKIEYNHSEPNLRMYFNQLEDINIIRIIDREVFLAMITAVFTLPCGVMAMSQDVENFVESSTNIASIKIEDNQLIVTTSQRSSLESKRDYISDIVTEIFEGCMARVEKSDGYPGWNPNLSSELLDIFKISYSKLFGRKIKVKAVHAGLECGLFSEKRPTLDMVSIGPTVRNAHSPDEKLEIATVDMFWKLIVDVLEGQILKH